MGLALPVVTTFHRKQLRRLGGEFIGPEGARNSQALRSQATNHRRDASDGIRDVRWFPDGTGWSRGSAMERMFWRL